MSSRSKHKHSGGKAKSPGAGLQHASTAVAGGSTSSSKLYAKGTPKAKHNDISWRTLMHSTLKGKHGHIADVISTLTRKEYPEIEVPELPIRPPLPVMPPVPQEASRAIREAWTAECDNIRAAYSLAVEDYKLTFMEVKAILDERIRQKETIKKEIKQDQDTEAKIVGDL